PPCSSTAVAVPPVAKHFLAASITFATLSVSRTTSSSSRNLERITSPHPLLRLNLLRVNDITTRRVPRAGIWFSGWTVPRPLCFAKSEVWLLMGMTVLVVRRAAPGRGSGRNMNTLLTEEEVAKHLHVSLASIRRWRLERRGPQFIKVGTLVRYRPEDLESWLSSLPTGG